DGVAHHHPAALGTRHRAADHDEAALDVDFGDFEILRRHAIHAVMAVHLLVLEGLARILAAARTTERTVRDRHAVRGFQPAEIPALHRTRETAADGDARDVDLLAWNEVVGLQHVTHIEQVRRIDAEFHELLLRLHFRFREVAAIGLGQALRLGETRTELNGGVAIGFFRAASDNLTAIKLQDRNGHMPAIL